MILLEFVDRGAHQHVSSQIAVIEIAHAGEERRELLAALLPEATGIMELTKPLVGRAVALEKLGFRPADALHAAAAEAWGADVLLSCDDKMCKAARRAGRKLDVRISNPLQWIEENPQ